MEPNCKECDGSGVEVIHSRVGVRDCSLRLRG